MHYEVYQDKKKLWRWRIRAGGGAIVATGNGAFKNKADCVHVINRFKNTAFTMEMIDLSTES